jgi:hypothetical protein
MINDLLQLASDVLDTPAQLRRLLTGSSWAEPGRTTA